MMVMERYDGYNDDDDDDDDSFGHDDVLPMIVVAMAMMYMLIHVTLMYQFTGPYRGDDGYSWSWW